jgi:SAM-dependent methyltransferase
MPVTADKADVIISNCVLNLVPDKVKAFQEIYRVLKPGGHFSVSDIVASGELPQSIKSGAELYAGCVSGAIRKEEYLGIIEETGFENIRVQKERVIAIPDDIYLKFISEEELKKFKESGVNLISINVYADKPKACCEPGSGCC